MTTEDIKHLAAKLDIAKERLDIYINRIHDSNLSGLVLSICDLADVRKELQVASIIPLQHGCFYLLYSLLQMTLGDWTIFKLLIETLRELRIAHHSPVGGASLPQSNSEAGDNVVMSRVQSQKSDNTTASQHYNRKHRPSMAQVEAENEQMWLEKQFGRMDTVECAGDRQQQQQQQELDMSSAANSVSGSYSHPPSVRFELEIESFADQLHNHSPITTSPPLAMAADPHLEEDLRETQEPKSDSSPRRRRHNKAAGAALQNHGT